MSEWEKVETLNGRHSVVMAFVNGSHPLMHLFLSLSLARLSQFIVVNYCNSFVFSFRLFYYSLSWKWEKSLWLMAWELSEVKMEIVTQKVTVIVTHSTEKKTFLCHMIMLFRFLHFFVFYLKILNNSLTYKLSLSYEQD